MLNMTDRSVALTVAGSDSGGGAGIQADLKTFSACGVYGASVITAVTAQNLSGVRDIAPIPCKTVVRQLEAVLEEYPVKVIKTGMLFSAEIIRQVSSVLAGYPHIPLVVDPVFVATSGSRLIEETAVQVLQERLFPLAALITPNLGETEVLLQRKISGPGDLEQGAHDLFGKLNIPVLVKGGHLEEDASDILVWGEGNRIFSAPREERVNSHGSGCTYASAVAAFLARGLDLVQAVSAAKEYISKSLRHALELSENVRVINHFWENR